MYGFILMTKVFLTICMGVIMFLSLSNLLDRVCEKKFNLKLLIKVILYCAFGTVSIAGVWLSWGLVIKIVITIGLLAMYFFKQFEVTQQLIAFEKKNKQSEDPEMIAYMKDYFPQEQIRIIARQLCILFMLCLLIVAMWVLL
ncbi:MAG: hypothetical protein QM205_05655 [Bacillota bacterium]|jgi:hypothetical protein|nr:hypothetical protein [Bacillota bacterium]HOF65715.1 hypothetical protein [Bacilli bacterium]